MNWASAAALLLATVGYFDSVSASLMTVTEYPSSCKAVYTSGTRSITVVQSTVTLSPTPWTDQDANSGSPFVLQVEPAYGMRKAKRRSEALYVMADGNTTTSISMAAICVIEDGTLSTIDGDYVSTSVDTTDQPFAFSSTLYPIDTYFFVEHGQLFWRNSAFENQVVNFWKDPADLSNGAQIYADLTPLNSDDFASELVVLVTMPANQTSSGGSGNGSPSTSAPGSSASSGSGSGGQSGGPTASASGGQGGEPSTSGSAASPSSTTLIRSPNGHCGGTTGYTCTDSGFGNCCSQYGYCGYGSAYCQPGCQPAFGICWTNSTSMIATGTASMSMPMSMTQTSMTSGSAQAIPTFVCPGDDGMTLSDFDGVEYELGCGRDLTAGPYGSTAVRYSFDECFALCDEQSHCQAWAYRGGTNGVGAGTCFFVDQVAGFINHDPNIVTGLRVSPPGRNFTASSSTQTSTFTSAATPIGPNNPSQSFATTSVSSSSMASSASPSNTPSAVVSSSPVAGGMSSSSSSLTLGGPSSSSSSPTAGGSSSSSTVVASGIPSLTSTMANTMSTPPATSNTSSSAGTIPTTSSSLMTSSTNSATPSMPTATSRPSSPPVCPAMNGTAYYDALGNEYVILCNTNTNPGAFNVSTVGDLGECINDCAGQTSQQCVGITFVAGACYFKSGYSGDSSVAGTDAAVLASVLGVNPPTYTYSPTPSSTSTSMSSSAVTLSSSSTLPPSSTSSGPSSSAPYLVLTSPTPCGFGDPPHTDEDDSYCEIDLPFMMQMYAIEGTATFASTNGYISLDSGSSQYSAEHLPDNNIPNNTVAPFFDDLYLYGNSNPQQGIFYQFNAGMTAVTYEYYVGRAGEANPIYHFTVDYSSTTPGVFTYTYYSTGGSGDEGIYAAVGTQGIDAQDMEEGYTYSYQTEGNIPPGLVVTCNTNQNVCVQDS